MTVLRRWIALMRLDRYAEWGTGRFHPCRNLKVARAITEDTHE